jgi:hypothetical protein
MNLLPSLLSFATLIQVINCRLLEPSSPVAATEQHDHMKEHRLFGDLFNKHGQTSDDQCEIVSTTYYEYSDDYYEYYFGDDIPLLSKEAVDEYVKYRQEFTDTGIYDMSDSEFFVPEYISNICDSDREDLDLKSTVTYLISLTEQGICAHEYYGFDQAQFINIPRCVRSTCTADSLIAFFENAMPPEEFEGCFIEDITVTEVTNTSAKKSILSID